MTYLLNQQVKVRQRDAPKLKHVRSLCCSVTKDDSEQVQKRSLYTFTQ